MDQIRPQPATPAIVTPKTHVQARELIVQAKVWHAQGSQSQVQAVDHALAAYFSSSRISKIGSWIPRWGQAASECVNTYYLRQFVQQYPQEAIELLGLPLTATQLRLGNTATRIAALRGLRLTISEGSADSYAVRASQDRSLFDSLSLKQICEEGLSAQQIAEQQIIQQQRRQDLLDADNPANTLSLLPPIDLFRLFRYLGVRRRENQELIPVVFAALQHRILCRILSADQTEFVIEIAQREPSLKALLGTGNDKIYVRTGRTTLPRRPGAIQCIPVSRFELATSTDLFSALLHPSQAPQLRTRGQELGLDAPVLDITDTSYDRQTLDILLNWLHQRSLPALTAQSRDNYIPQLQRLFSILNKESASHVESTLIDQLSDDTVHQLVQISLDMKMSALLGRCITHINNTYPEAGQIITLPSGHLSIKIGKESYPPHIWETLTLLFEKATTLHFQRMIAQAATSTAKSAPSLRSRIVSDIHRFATRTTLKVMELSFTLMALCAVIRSFNEQSLSGLGYEWQAHFIPPFVPTFVSWGCLLTVKALHDNQAQIIALAKRIRASISELITDPLGMKSFMSDVLHRLSHGVPEGLNHIVSQLVQHPAAGRRIKSLNLSDCSDLDDPHLRYLIESCPNLEKLTLSVDSRVTHESLQYLHRLHRLGTLVVIVPRSTLSRWSMGSLEDLNIAEQFGERRDFHVQIECMGSFAGFCGTPRFFRNLGANTSVAILKQGDFGSLTQIASWCPQVSTIEVRSAWSMRTRDCESIARICFQLHSLRIEGDLSNESLAALAQSRTLRHLAIANPFRHSLTSPGIASLVQARPELESLAIYGLTEIGDLALERLATLNRLRRLCIVGNSDISDDGLLPLLNKPQPPEVTLYRLNRPSARVLARAARTGSPETTALVRRLRAGLSASILPEKHIRKDLQRTFHGLLDLLIKNHFLMGFPWPHLVRFAPPQLAEGDPALIPMIAEADLETFKQTLQTRLRLTRVPAGNRELRFELSQVRLLAQIVASHFDAMRKNATAYQQSWKSHEAQVIEGWNELFPNGLTWIGDKLKGAHAAPKLYHEMLALVLDALADASPTDYRNYLVQAFPEMDIEVVDRILAEFSDELSRIGQAQQDELSMLGTIAPTLSPAVVRQFTAIVGDERWRWAFTTFLDRIAEEGDRAGANWTDQHKLAVTLAGLFAFSTLLQRLRPAAVAAVEPAQEEVIPLAELIEEPAAAPVVAAPIVPAAAPPPVQDDWDRVGEGL